MVETEIGEVMDFFAHVGAIALKLNSSLKIGDKIRIKGGEQDFTETINSMQINRKPVQEAKAGDDVGIKITGKAHRGYRVFKVE